MSSKLIVHVSEIDLSLNGGMSRVEVNWKNAFERRGIEFIHIGPNEVGYNIHKGIFPYKAYSYFKNLKIKPDAFIVHEPSAGVFTNRSIPCFLESHGIERRGWENDKSAKNIKTRILFPLWRLKNCDKGLLKANKLLLINSEDQKYVEKKYNRKKEDILVFKNGVNRYLSDKIIKQSVLYTILFNGSWIERKGISLLVKAAIILFEKGIRNIQYLIIGTSKNKIQVLADWPEYMHTYIKVIEKFDSTQEINFINSSDLFVLPSFFEGQPLSLLQAMHAGICCITTNTCGQKDIIDHGKTGLFIPIGDHDALANMMNWCYENKDKSNSIGLSAAFKMADRTWQNVSDEVVDYVLQFS